MTLSELFKGICELPDDLRGREVTGVTSDTRELRRGDLFVCIKGLNFDGNNAAEEMLSKGAVAVVTGRKLSLPGEITLSDPRAAYPQLLSNFYGNPTSKLKIGAVTGTNGKTTIVNLCAGITRKLGFRTGVIGTLGIDTGGGREYTHNGPPTTPEPRRLYELFAKMVEEGTRCCFLEASSQALAQSRFAREHFFAGGFTNLTRDHLDYHGTMENYFAAKLKLFDIADNAVICIDDEYGKRAAEYCAEKGIAHVTVSVCGEADFYTEAVKLKPGGSEFILTDRAARKSYSVKFPMTGYYNVSNAVQAAVMCSFSGLALDECLDALEKTEGVCGRLETLYDGDYTVIRDFAHTGDGLEKLLSSLKSVTTGRLISVFGAAGERDPGKRPEMGAAAARHSDVLIVTTDSPRHEDPQQTIDDVARGIPRGREYLSFVDRREAIYAALEMARENDVVALCGKGHEDFQAIGSEYLHFDEKEIVEEWLSRAKENG